MLYESPYLIHFGIPGQKWGQRRYQNPDGSLTPEGQARYGTVENYQKVRAQRKAKIKKGLAIAGGVAAAGALAYGGYQLYKHKRLHSLPAGQQQAKIANKQVPLLYGKNPEPRDPGPKSHSGKIRDFFNRIRNKGSSSSPKTNFTDSIRRMQNNQMRMEQIRRRQAKKLDKIAKILNNYNRRMG